VTLSTQAEATQLVRVRDQLSRAERDAGRPAVPYDAIIAKIVARALRDHPILNSAVDGEEIVIFDEVNIAIAVSVEDGLVAPVITNVDQKSLPDVSQEIVAVAERARNRALTLDDLTGGTFGISNLGLYGVESFTPILIPPQTGILGLGAIAHRPVAVDNDHVEVRQTMALSLTFDHRVTDGVPAGRFLQRVRELIESPWLLFW
jgi:pyruvate dehydrogenase E2 component (dihydrolipoamide acetyltransferase)